MPASEPLDASHSAALPLERGATVSMRLRHAALSDVGIKRDHNEDSYLAAPELGLFAVADGMGGHAGGETASRVSITTLYEEIASARREQPDTFSSREPLARTPLANVLRDALEAACAAVHHAARVNPELNGMGTTTTAVLLEKDLALVAHVGDSRLYLVRGEYIQQITEDHSLVHEQVKAGILTEEEAKTSRFKNIITRSIGYEEDVLVDVLGLHVQAGDTLLLCSDGLSNLVEDYEMREIVRTSPLDEAPKGLIDLANARGGDDNITAVLVRIEEPQ